QVPEPTTPRRHQLRSRPADGTRLAAATTQVHAMQDLSPDAGPRYTAAMPNQARSVAPGPRARTVRADDGSILPVPDGWSLLPPGDPALTGRVKKAGPCWTVTEKRGRKTFSHGVWAPESVIESIKSALLRERDDPAYARKLESGRQQRAAEQAQYAEDFHGAVERFLGFASVHAELADRLAKAIVAHAVPVGSGTVARTKRIPIERRAEAATIAWLRHATTEYDHMHIPRVKGMRREVRRLLADRSRQLLARYRRGEPIAADSCVLRRALAAS
ncbi:MAG TPA: DUF2293 domain-containing protein, partial [Polyangiales bacterium]|nr:DUF2293 domain-containing protein [Polyangiales bacterium]